MITYKDLTGRHIELLKDHSGRPSYDARMIGDLKALGDWKLIEEMCVAQWMWLYEDTPKKGFTRIVTLQAGKRAIEDHTDWQMLLATARTNRYRDEASF